MKFCKSILNIQILSVLLAAVSWADCPFEFKSQSQTYCMSIEWIEADKKNQGVWTAVLDQSPHLNVSGLRPEKWIYSKAYVDVWLAKDQFRQPVFIDGLKVYPFMMMLGGHSHGAKSNWQHDTPSGRYILSQMNFQEMVNGCWQLRMQIKNDVPETAIMSIDRFVNISVEANVEQSVMCSLCEAEAGGVTSPVSGHGH